MKHIISIVISQYEDLLIRWYARIRFLIINVNILEILLNYIPRTGRLVTLGCGFGLFECAIALVNPGLDVIGYDINARRIHQATCVARKLNLRNVRFICADATDESVRNDCDCVLTLDLLHHIPHADQEKVLERCQRMLGSQGVLVVKDIHCQNVLKLAFTWLLDKVMTKNNPLYYFDQRMMRQRLTSLGFHILELPISDWLPYPHIVYIGLRMPFDSGLST